MIPSHFLNSQLYVADECRCFLILQVELLFIFIQTLNALLVESGTSPGGVHDHIGDGAWVPGVVMKVAGVGTAVGALPVKMDWRA